MTALGALLVLAMAAVAWASAEGGEAHGLNWKDFGYRIVNFILVVGIIWKLGGKKIAAFFRGAACRSKTSSPILRPAKSKPKSV